MKRISPTDAIFLDAERPSTPPLIGCLILLDPATAPGSFVRHRDILDYVESRLHVAPNLRRRLVYHPLGLDEPRLIDDPDFDLEFHVRHLALPKPRDRRQLSILAARLMSRPMDLHRPLWEMYIIEGLEEIEGVPEDGYAMMLKLHHAAFDGAAAGAAIWAMMQDDPNYRPDPPSSRWTPERKPDVVGWTISSIQEGLSQAAANLKALPGLARAVGRGAAASARAANKGPKAPRTRFQGRVTSHRVFDWVIFSRDEFKTMRAGLGKPKINDMILCIIGGALRRYLERRKELPADSLLVMCPINVRGAGDPTDGGNHVSAMRATLGTDIADPTERLAAIAASTARGKGGTEAWGGDFASDALALYPYYLRSRLVRGATALTSQMDVAPFANTVITNIPNPPGGYYFAGSRVLEYAGFGPLADGLGLFHTVSGMDWEISVSVTSCREIMPDIADYIDDIRASYAELKARAEAVASPTESAGSAKEAKRSKAKN